MRTNNIKTEIDMKKLNLLLMVLLTASFCYAQDNGQLIKVSEFSISNITTIEERVFMLHYITDKGYFCFKNANIPNTIDVYISSDAPDELSNFDFFYDNLLYDQLNELSFLDKTQRGELFVDWRQDIGDELYEVLYDDFSKNFRSSNASCDGAFPFYTGNGSYNFPASVNAGDLGSNTSPFYCSGFIRPNGMTTSCLSTTPNPAFYFMRISEPGNLVISIHSEPQYDIDFDCWGPFYDINTVCDLLSCNNMVDCSYSANDTEFCYIDNAQTGQYYMLLITNYSNQECNIIFENLGSGTTEPIAKVTLTAGNVWGDGTGYQMLLDADANTLGTTIPYVGALSTNCTGNGAIYNEFEYKIPTNADGNCSTGNIVLNNSKTITIPAGTYDWCITNPTPDDRIWIAGSGRGNNTEFEVGKTYEFTATMKSDGHDIVNATINNGDITPYVLNVSAYPNYGGVVVGGGTFVQGQYCNPIAYANEGYSLFSWTENDLLVVTDPNYSFPITGNIDMVANFVPAGGNKCTLVFDLYDSYGDGWNNAKLNVAFNNGLPTQHLTMFSGSSASYELEVNDGAVVTLTWTSGLWDSECSFNVHYENGTMIYQGSNLSSSFSHSFQMDCPGSTTNYTISVSANPSNGGTVTGGGTYQQGQSCNVTAASNIGYTFTNWTENGNVVSTQASYTFTVTSNRTLVANFTQQQFTINVTANPTNSGTVTGGGTYIYGQSCSVTATPNPNFNFINWTENGNPVSIQLSYTFTVTSNRNLVANFTTQNYIINANAYPTDGGTISGAGGYDYGQTCTLTATPATGYEFINWIKDGSQVSTETSYSFTVTESALYEAHFQLQSFTINASANPEEGGSVTGGGSYYYGQTCYLEATPVSDYTFINWTKEGEFVSNQLSYSFTVTENASYEANFDKIIFEITATADPINGGDVSGAGTYSYGDTCILTATARTGFVFENWTRNDIVVSTSPSYPFQVSRNADYVAHFTMDANHCIITAMADPNEGGTVSGDGTFELGDMCTLDAIPADGYEFVNWTLELDGSQVSTDASFSFPVTGDAVYVAHFVRKYTITANVEPIGAGSIIGTGTFKEGESCTLIATPNPTYSFEKWTENGEDVSTDNPYSFTVDRERDLVAVFYQGLFFTIKASAGANGTISPSEGDVLVEPGEDITFTMIPNSGCKVSKVLVDGVDRGPIPEHKFRNVNEDHTIHVEFSGLGIDDNIEPELKIYPNPAHDKIYIESPNMKKVSIFNLVGVQIENKEVNDDYTFVNTNEYPQGTYILKVENNDGRIGYTRFILVK